MSKRLLVIGSLFVLVTGFSFYALTNHPEHQGKSSNSTAASADLILYYGETCPHCKIVEQYITDNKIDQKIKIAHKEIYNNQANNDELVSKANYCQLDLKTVGVPFLWTGADCLIGDQPIIDFLNQQVK